MMAIQQCLYPMPETKVSICTVFFPFFFLIVASSTDDLFIVCINEE